MNTDQSTNNLSHFYWYCRDSICSNFYNKYRIYMVWAMMTGFIQIQIGSNTLNGIIHSNGITSDFWYFGLGMLYGQLLAHYLLFYSESNAFNISYIIFAFLGMMTWPLNIWINDNAPGTWYYKNQWTIVQNSIIFHLSGVI